MLCTYSQCHPYYLHILHFLKEEKEQQSVLPLQQYEEQLDHYYSNTKKHENLFSYTANS